MSAVIVVTLCLLTLCFWIYSDNKSMEKRLDKLLEIEKRLRELDKKEFPND